MDCPKCRVAMKAEQHEGIELDRCESCGGLFFDAGELEAIVKRLAGQRVDDSPTVDFAAADDKEATCPRCDVAMTPEEGPRKDLHIDRCPQCAGIFLDRGELGTLQLWSTLTGKLQ